MKFLKVPIIENLFDTEPSWLILNFRYVAEIRPLITGENEKIQSVIVSQSGPQYSSFSMEEWERLLEK